MIADRSHLRWLFGCTAAAMAALAAYLAYALTAPNGPTGGSRMGLAFAAAGTAVIVFECLLGVRKNYPALPLGTEASWLKAHIWLGLLSFVLILFHTGFEWGQGLAAAMMWLLTAITVSGIFGVSLGGHLPQSRWLQIWLYVHVPLSMALLVLIPVHAVMSLRY